MDLLKHYQEITELGNKIIAEFSHDDRFSLTKNWISQYVAELMFKVEHEKDENKRTELKKECFSTILKLWNSRTYFPENAKPLGKMRETIAIIQLMIVDDNSAFPWRRYQHDNTTWGLFMHTIVESIEDILEISLLTSSLRANFINEKEWLKFEKFLSEEENNAIRYLDFLLNKCDNEIKIKYINKDDETDENTSKGKFDLLIERLQFLIDKQQIAFNELKEKLKVE